MARFSPFYVTLHMLFLCVRFCRLNPISAFSPHMLAHPSFMHPAALYPMYPMQYPAFPVEPMAASSSNLEDQTKLPTAATDAKKDEEDDDDNVNKRDDDETFWEAASSYGRNRWTNFRDGFTELWDVFRAAGRGFKGIFTFGE